jgi:hypothetical protein
LGYLLWGPQTRGVGGGVKRYGSYWVLWPLCVFGCIPVIIMEGVCDRDCKGLVLCAVGTAS